MRGGLGVEENHRCWVAVPVVEYDCFYLAADRKGEQNARQSCVDETVVGLVGVHKSEKSEKCRCRRYLGVRP